MGFTNRTAEILRRVRLHGSCNISDLAEQLQVSDETVRRNIKPLVDRGLALKVHGGIMLPDRLEELPFQKRMHENKTLKQSIATRVAQQIQNGESLILDGGATTMHIALALGRHRDLQAVTNSTEIARSLLARDNNHVHIAGGELRADDASAFGAQTQAFIRRFRVRHAILSIAAINPLGFFNQNPCEAEFAQTAMTQAERVIVAADHTKFGRSSFVKVCDLDKIDMLITDIQPPKPLYKLLVEAGVEILVANESDTHAQRA